jgi:hypothetical protein
MILENRFVQRGEVDRFREVDLEAVGFAAPPEVIDSVAGQRNETTPGKRNLRSQRGKQIVTIHIRQADVYERDVRQKLDGRREGIGRTVSGAHLTAGLFQEHAEYLGRVHMVIDNQHARPVGGITNSGTGRRHWPTIAEELAGAHCGCGEHGTVCRRIE